MAKFIIKKLLIMALTVFLISLTVFYIITSARCWPRASA